MRVLLESENGVNRICVIESKREADISGLLWELDLVTSRVRGVLSTDVEYNLHKDYRIITYSWKDGSSIPSTEVCSKYS